MPLSMTSHLFRSNHISIFILCALPLLSPSSSPPPSWPHSSCHSQNTLKWSRSFCRRGLCAYKTWLDICWERGGSCCVTECWCSCMMERVRAGGQEWRGLRKRESERQQKEREWRESKKNWWRQSSSWWNTVYVMLHFYDFTPNYVTSHQSSTTAEIVVFKGIVHPKMKM